MPCGPEFFEALGCVVEDAKVEAAVEPAWQAMIKLRGWQQGGFILPTIVIRPPRAAQARSHLGGRNRPGPQRFRHHRRLGGADDLVDGGEELFGRYDYLVLPSAQIFPFPVEDRWPKTVAGRHAHLSRMDEGGSAGHARGLPGLVVPAGFDARGLPIGLQIVGPNRGEVACLQLAKAYEAATGWTEKRPPSA